MFVIFAPVSGLVCLVLHELLSFYFFVLQTHICWLDKLGQGKGDAEGNNFFRIVASALLGLVSLNKTVEVS